MLRPPSGNGFIRQAYADGDSLYSNGADLSATNIVEVTIPPRRRDTTDSYGDHIDDWIAGPSDLSRRNTSVIQQIANFNQVMHLELHGNEEGEEFFDDDVRRFINPALLSHLAVQLRDLVPRGTHVKGSIPYPRAFTGKDIVVRILTFFIHVCPSDDLQRSRSLLYIQLYNEGSSVTMARSTQQTDAPLFSSHAPSSRLYFSMRWSGVHACCRTAWKRCTCLWMIKRVLRMRLSRGPSCRLALWQSSQNVIQQVVMGEDATHMVVPERSVDTPLTWNTI